MEYKEGDKVRITGNSNCHEHRIGEVVTLDERTGRNEWVAGSWFVKERDFEPYGKVLSELDVNPGDVVECVKSNGPESNLREYTVEKGKSGLGENVASIRFEGAPNLMNPNYSAHLFRVVSRGPTWKLEEPEGEYETAKDSEGNVVAYRQIPQIVEKVDRTVTVSDGPDGSWKMVAAPTNAGNAKLFGETVDGKPVGDWIIRFEQDQGQT